MVHVSDAGGRHKMLAFATEPTINTITIKEDGSTTTTTTTSATTPGSNNTTTTTTTTIITKELKTNGNLTNLSIITEEPTNFLSNMNTNLLDGNSNGNNDNNVENNENANFIPDDNSSGTSDVLLNNSENQALLINSNSPDSNNKVFTEEIIVISNGKKVSSPNGKMISAAGFTKGNNSSSNSSSSPNNKKQWRNNGRSQSQSDCEESPLLQAAETTSIDTNMSTPTNPTATTDNSNGSTPGATTPVITSNMSSSKPGKLTNGTKHAGLKRVSFGSSKGSMVETLIYESPVSEEPEIAKTGKSGAHLTNGTAKSVTSHDPDDSTDSNASGGSTGGSRPPSRVRVTFFESEKPLAVSSPESDIADFDLSNMTLPSSPSAIDGTPPAYNRQMSTDSGRDNPFRPDGELSKEADLIVELLKEGKPINDETLRSKSPSVNETMNSVSYTNALNASPAGKGAKGSAPNGAGGSGSVEVQHGVVGNAGQVEHVVIKKKKGCCVIQ